MLFHVCGILIFIVCGKSLSKENFTAASTCVVSNKFIEIREEQVPKIETEVSSIQDVKVTAAFRVDPTGDSITGNITFTFDGGRDLINFIIKLTQKLNERRRDKKKYYFPLEAEEEDEMNKSSWHADLNCLHIPLTPSAVLKAEVFQINMTSCSCDIIEMAVNVTDTCIDFCHMNPVSTHSFPASREACYLFREHYHDEVFMTLKADKIYTNFTRFRGYFTNVNPYATIHVSVFPDDYRHEPHLPLWTSLVKVTAEREIYFSVVANSLGYTRFYSKMTVSCNKDEIGDEFISETATLVIKEIINIGIAGDDDDSTDSQDDDSDDDDYDDDHYPSVKREVVYGTVVGLLSVCSVITAFVWLKILQRRMQTMISQSVPPAQTMISQSVQTMISQSVPPVQTMISQSVQPAQTMISQSVQTMISQSVQPVQTMISQSVQPAQTMISQSVQLVQTMISQSVQPAQTMISQSVQTMISQSVQPVQTMISQSVQPAQTMISQSVQLVQTMISQSVQPVQTMISQSVQPVQTMISQSVQSDHDLHCKLFRMNSSNRGNICEEANLEDSNSQTAFQTSSLYFTESKNNQRYCQRDGSEPQDKKVMLVFHPDSDRHSENVEKLILCLEKFNICVNDRPEHPFWNWRDFAEKVGEEYEDVIVVLSNGLIELCKLYRKKGNNLSVHNKRWNELFEQRHGEYIPCVVFDKLRTLVQDKCSNGRTHFVTFVDNSEDCDAVCAYKTSDTVSLHECCDTATICYHNVTSHYSNGNVSLNGSNYKVCLSNNSDSVCVSNNSDSVCLSNNSGTVRANEGSNTVGKKELSDTVDKVIMFHKDVDPNYCECNNLQDRVLYKGMHDSKKKSNICSDTMNKKDFSEFFRLYTFWNPENTYFNAISTHVLRHSLLSEQDSHFETTSEHTLSLMHILKNLE